MTERKAQEGDRSLSAFELLLDTFGGDAERWPVARRVEAERLLLRQDAAGATARRLLGEARALDRVLATMPLLDRGRTSALSARILAETRRTAGSSPRPSNVVPLGGAVRKALGRPTMRPGWAVAAVLAASLLVGVVIGPGTAGLPALRDAVDVFGLGGIADQLALAPIEDDGSADEDVL